MNNQTLKLAIGLAISSISVPLLADVTLYDYSQATSAYEDAYLSASANIAKSRNDAQSAFDFKLKGNYDKVISTTLRDTTLKANADGLVSRSGTAGAKSNDSYTVG